MKLWDAATRKAPRTFTHGTEVICQAFSPDGKQLASIDFSGKVKLWDVASGKEVSGFQAHSGPTFMLAFSPDGKLLATASIDGTIRLFDASFLAQNLGNS
jgi:WD40 repeat protein